MKIFQMIDNPYVDNPYISTLMNGISGFDSNIIWGYGLKNFWSDVILQYDIIHIHWPHLIVDFFSDNKIIDEYEKRLLLLKSRGIKILVTCHNLEPHYEKDVRKIESYRVSYKLADSILHLGEYSMNIMEVKYPIAKHYLIPHHTYDALYSIVNKEESLKKLCLDSSKKYILCFGDFRNDEERKLVSCVLEHYNRYGYEILAPLYYNYSNRRNKIKMFVAWLRSKFASTKLHIIGQRIDDNLLPYYYGASEICLIQRKKILNSGNLPMAFYMGKVVVGPNVGNVGQILQMTDNPVFNPENEKSIYDAIDKGLILNEQGVGAKNREYSVNNWSTIVIAQKLYNIYNSI